MELSWPSSQCLEIPKIGSVVETSHGSYVATSVEYFWVEHEGKRYSHRVFLYQPIPEGQTAEGQGREWTARAWLRSMVTEDPT